ncbi:hypothetical protein ACQ27_gp180 [Klebsiella phage K64-1]|nr:hypothetical protein ACQ27_gp180 [Klebsiella phage K64-1]
MGFIILLFVFESKNRYMVFSFLLLILICDIFSN